MRRPLSSINKISFKQTRSRVAKTLKDGIQVNMSTQGSKKLLRSHVNKKTNLVIMFVDINNSTQMSLSLPENKFALIVQTFAQEISIAVEAYGGYVFKYEGDAVIALFHAENDRITACKNALNCSRSILEIIGKILNPALKANELSEITVRIGMAYGHALVVLYGKNLDKAHLDILGSSISLASKIASIAKPNQVLVGEHVYNIIKPSVASNSFREVNLDPAKWKYISSSDPESLYRVYEFLVNLQL
jgi:adenylate cyclase